MSALQITLSSFNRLQQSDVWVDQVIVSLASEVQM